MQFHILVFFEFFTAVKGDSSLRTIEFEFINYIKSDEILYLESFSLITFSFPNRFKTKSLLFIYFLKNFNTFDSFVR